VIRNLEIVGEARRYIERSDPGFGARHSKFPLKAAMAMRNVLAHGYFASILGSTGRRSRCACRSCGGKLIAS
jgi:uncharacterized protein with HEPN domain